MNEDRLRRSPNVGIVGSTSLLGRELKELLEDGGFPLGRLIPFETEEYAGLLQEFAGDLQITQIISPGSLEDVDIAFFTCGPEIMSSYVRSGAPFPELTIDLTQSGRPGQLFLSGLSDTASLGPRGYFVNPHPTAIVMARVLSRLHNVFGVRTASATVLQSASERANAGVDELQEQTVNLLNFQTVECKVFGGQLAFNMLRSEDPIGSQFTRLMGRTFPQPMMTTLQAPVFHSHCFSIFVELLHPPEADAVRDALAADSSFVVHAPDDEPSPIGVVGKHGIHIGRIQEAGDRIALWAVADNLRIAASNAIRTAENIMLTAIGDRL